MSDKNSRTELLTISAYTDPERSKLKSDFQCYVSPEAIKMSQKNNFSVLSTVNANHPQVAFSSGGKNTMELDIILDGSGAYAVKDKQPVSIKEQVQNLLSTTMRYDGKIHQPLYLAVKWGELDMFKAKAESLDIDYKTFNSQAAIIAAHVKLVLIEDIPFDLSQAQANKQSPDLFHYHVVADDETLPLISYDYYQDTSHLHLIATQNKLNSLYDCVRGTTLLIPPLNVNET